MSVVAVIPAWNEQGAIGVPVRRLPRPLICHVVVVDGGSTDDTVAEAQDAGAVVIRQQRRGYGAACAEGAAHATSLGARVLLFLDGDGADAAEEAARLVGPVLDGTADFTIANRALRAPGSMLWHQVLAGRVIGAAVGLATGTRYRDMAAFRAVRPETLAALGMSELGFGWNLEMQFLAAARHLRIEQIDMPYGRRVAGSSKVAGSLGGTVRATGAILRTLARLTMKHRPGN